MKAGCSGLGFGAGLPRLRRAPGSALPPARSSSTSGKLTPRAVFAFTCPVCKHAWRGRFRSQPQTAAIHGPSPCSGARSSPRRGAVHAGTPKRSRMLPALPRLCADREMPECGRAKPCFHLIPSLSDAFPLWGSRGQGKWEGEANRPFDTLSFFFPKASA